MVRKVRKVRKVRPLPVRGTRRKKKTGPDRKLSDIVKEMGFRLLEKPEAPVSFVALRTVILLASAAWNAALGAPGVRERHREMLAKLDGEGRGAWPELVSGDTDLLIAGLVEFKKVHYPNDRRRIVEAEASADGSVRIHWVEEVEDGEDGKVVAAAFGSVGSGATATIPGGSHPIADRLVANMKRVEREKVVSLPAVVAGRAAADEMQRTVASWGTLAGMHPARAAYVYAQNQVSVMSEQLTSLKEMAPLAELVSAAEELYRPGGPPVSPLTTSYFTCWAFFDACVGPAGETIGTTILEVGAASGMNAELLRLIRQMQESRMGIYEYEGTRGGLVILRDVVSSAVCHAVAPPSHRGERGELWYARVLPPPHPDGLEHVVFTTPYLLLEPGLGEWQAYFRRTLPDGPKQARLDAYERHMKYGPARDYWNEFVLEGYVNYRPDFVYLRGLPDVPESRPHSRVNFERSLR